MSCTPDQKTAKFSPFGSAISKNLLTPCRRVGLSRKRNSRSTPLSGINTPSNKSQVENRSPNTTPLCSKNGLLRSSKTSMTKNSSSVTPGDANSDLCSKPNERLTSDGDKSCRKALVHNFTSKAQSTGLTSNGKIKGVDRLPAEDSDPPDEEEKPKENLNQSYCELTTLDHNTLEVVTLEKSKLPDIPQSLDIMQCIRQEDAENSNGIDTDFTRKSENLPDAGGKKQNENHSKKCKKTLNKHVVKPTASEISQSSLNSDDDFDTTDKTLKKRKSISSTDKKMQKLTFEKSDSLKDCSILLEKASTVSIQKIKSFVISDNELSDSDFIIKKKKRKCIIDDDDDDSINYSTKISVNKESPQIPLTSTTRSLEDDEEMAFTSTPELEMKEKKDLICKITELEKQIKKKQQRLEDLKQASIYKNKHNIAELDDLTNKWKLGCELALKSLLSQLQTHGPINISMLMANLHIPSDIANKLSLKGL